MIKQTPFTDALVVTLGILMVVAFGFVMHDVAAHDPNWKWYRASSTVPRYERAAFGDWATVHGRCNTREVVLERDSGPRAVDTDNDLCDDDGTVLDVYTGQLVPAKDTQIDHVYPVAEAWREGAYRWTFTQRHAFYNDQRNLVAVLGSVNEAKGDLTPSEMLQPATPPHWKPPTPAGQCAFATIYRSTAEHWHLPIPAADDTALRTMATSCP
jgi:hypothetical protein